MFAFIDGNEWMSEWDLHVNEYKHGKVKNCEDISNTFSVFEICVRNESVKSMIISSQFLLAI